MRICFVGGCGKIGLCHAVLAAKNGYDVICADIDAFAVDQVNKGQPTFYEPALDNMLKVFSVKATDDTVAAVKQSEIVFVIVPTPSEPNGSLSIDFVKAACKDIGIALRDHDLKAIVIISTIMPGDTNNGIRNTLEFHSAKKAGIDFGLFYAPELVRQGQILCDLTNAPFVILGHDCEIGRAVVENYYRKLTRARVLHMSTASAEIAKIGLNFAIVAKISVANLITQL
ncbi:MAG: hypothetical protein ACXAB4_06300, partial [Candidatus Hodarchaeales archaeon]